MADRNLDLALKISADLDQAAKEVTALDASLTKVKASGQTAASGLNTATTAADKNTKALKADAAAANVAAAAHTKQAAAVKSSAKAMDIGGISAGQYKNAMRQLPAQITDIVTGLASGQSVFAVTIQQGGQLKDSFGGVVPAAKALLGAISPMAVGVTAGAAAIGIMAVALHQAAEEQQAFTVGLLQTGNYADVTVGSLEAMVTSLSSIGSVSQGQAREALLQVAESGRIAGDQFELVATAAARMEAAAAQSIETTIQKFEEIAKDPVQALLKLNETEHFLTQEHINRLDALVALGLEQQAAAEGAEIYADRLNDIADAAEASRSNLNRMWADAKQGASDAWEATKDIAEFLASTAVEFEKRPWYQRVGPAAGVNFIRDMYNAQPAQAAEVPRVAGAIDSGEDNKKREAEKKREQERKQFQAEESRYLADAARKKQEIIAVDDLVTRGVISQEQAIKRKNQIEESYARKAAKKPKGGKTDAQQAEESAQREIDNLTKQIALTATLEDGERQVSNEARVAYEIKAGTYKLASAAAQQELLAAAKRRDAQLEEIEAEEKKRKEFERTEKAYEQLRDQLRTPAEADVGDAINQINVLIDALNQGSTDAVKFQRDLERAIGGAFTKAPELQLPGQQPFYLVDDQAQIADEANRLQKWYDQQMEMLAQFRAEKAEFAAQWDAQELQTQAQHQASLAALQRAQYDLQVNATQSIFDSMASIARSAAGEQSKAYRVLYAISKGFAISQAAIALATNVANASKVGFPQNLPLIAAAFAQGAQIASLIAGSSYTPAGYATGGRIVGPGTPTSDSVPIWASRDEHMIRASSATQPGARSFLDAFNERGMAALHDWNGFGHYADGGAITTNQITAAPEPRYRPGAAAPATANLQSEMALYMFNDQESMREAFMSNPKTRKAFITLIAENGQAIKAAWNS